MSIARVTKVVAGVFFLLAGLGVPGLGGISLVPLGLAVWVIGEAAS